MASVYVAVNVNDSLAPFVPGGVKVTVFGASVVGFAIVNPLPLADATVSVGEPGPTMTFPSASNAWTTNGWPATP